MNSLNHIKSQYIILDTCILIDLSQPHLKSPLIDLIIKLKKNHNKFYYSQYSIFELLRGQSRQVAKDYNKILKIAKSIPITKNTLSKASDLMCAYKHNRIISSATTSKSKNENLIDDGDYIIGATAFQYKQTSILTRNYTDFPRPFFTEIGKHYINFTLEKKKKKKKGCEAYFLLEPNIYFENIISQIRN